MTKVHKFDESFVQGLKGEAYLDNFFARTYPDMSISEVSRDEQRKGIDRTFNNGTRQWNVEYKTDYMTNRTGNIFLEMTVNHYPKPKLGWVVGSQADVLVYYIPEYAVFSLSFSLLRSKLDDYVKQLIWKVVKNEKYSAYGMILPLKRFERDFKMKVWKF